MVCQHFMKKPNPKRPRGIPPEARHKITPQYGPQGPQGYAIRTVAETARLLGITVDKVTYAERTAMKKIYEALREEAAAHGFFRLGGFKKADRRRAQCR
jgi:hypothetical protein